MGKTVAIIQARMGSLRLPGKVLKDIYGKPLLEHIVNRLRHCKSINQIVISTTFLKEDIPILRLAEKIGIDCFTGPQHNVLLRFIKTGKAVNAETILRVCGDNPLIDINLIEIMISSHLKTLPDITFVGTKVPLGSAAEVVQFNSLLGLLNLIDQKCYLEHVTPFFYDHPGKFILNSVEVPDYLKENSSRLTVDTEEDLTVIKAIYRNLYKPKRFFSTKKAVIFLKENPHISKINQYVRQKYWRESQ